MQTGVKKVFIGLFFDRISYKMFFSRNRVIVEKIMIKQRIAVEE